MTTLAQEVDEALSALAEVSVALTSIYPVLRVVRVPQEVLGFIEDGMDGASRARRHLTALRAQLSDNGGHSVKVGPA